LESFRFDAQSQRFDQRAGIPPPATALIAGALRGLCRFEPRDLLVEIGAGTGEIGCDLARQHGRYLGIDVARPCSRSSVASSPSPRTLHCSCKRTRVRSGPSRTRARA
jgi:tRNA G46 methylase TrmB